MTWNSQSRLDWLSLLPQPSVTRVCHHTRLYATFCVFLTVTFLAFSDFQCWLHMLFPHVFPPPSCVNPPHGSDCTLSSTHRHRVHTCDISAHTVIPADTLDTQANTTILWSEHSPAVDATQGGRVAKYFIRPT